jgi:hypothetical protein
MHIYGCHDREVKGSALQGARDEVQLKFARSSSSSFDCLDVPRFQPAQRRTSTALLQAQLYLASAYALKATLKSKSLWSSMPAQDHICQPSIKRL